MNYLAIDTSGKNLTIVISKNDKIYTYYDSECGVGHSVNLMPKVEQLAIECDFDFNSADFFGCVVGAGSFTGIRIGISTIKAMCFAYKKPCLSITSFDTLAYNEKGKILAVIDAKHNGFYVCGYQDEQIVLEPSYIMKEQVELLAKEYKVVSSTYIDGISHEIASVKDGLIKAIEKNSDKSSCDLETLVPLYVRKSQAEEGR